MPWYSWDIAESGIKHNQSINHPCNLPRWVLDSPFSVGSRQSFQIFLDSFETTRMAIIKFFSICHSSCFKAILSLYERRRKSQEISTFAFVPERLSKWELVDVWVDNWVCIKMTGYLLNLKLLTFLCIYCLIWKNSNLYHYWRWCIQRVNNRKYKSFITKYLTILIVAYSLKTNIEHETRWT